MGVVVQRVLFLLVVLSGSHVHAQSTVSAPTALSRSNILQQEYSQAIKSGQIAKPELIPSDPRIGAAAPVLLRNQVVVSDVYHNGELFQARVKPEQMLNCKLQFKEIPPYWLPVFGPIFHVEAVFEFDSKNPLNLFKQKMQRNFEGHASAEDVASSTTERLVVSAEPEVLNTNTLNSLGFGFNRYAMIYRAVTKEQFVRENFQTPEMTRKKFFSRSIHHETKPDASVCWDYFLQMMHESNITHQEQVLRAQGEQVSSYRYLTLGTNCVSLAVGNLAASQGVQVCKQPSLPGTAIDKDDWLAGGIRLAPKKDVSPREWDVVFKATRPDEPQHIRR